MDNHSEHGGWFWQTLLDGAPLKMLAVATVVAVAVVSCGREGAAARQASSDYNSLPSGTTHPIQPAERLGAISVQLRSLLSDQTDKGLTPRQAKRALALRDDLTRTLIETAEQVKTDRQKLADRGADRAAARADRVIDRYNRLSRQLRQGLAATAEDGQQDDAAAKAGAALASLVPQRAPQSRSAAIGFGTQDPISGTPSRSAGLVPAYGVPSGTGAPSSLPREPDAADLQLASETSSSPAIQLLAQRLDHDPVKIYQYVKNRIRYEPYYGIRKGADLTLKSRSGSDADQSSLLVALLRQSDVPARFVAGTVELTADRAANWLGVDVEQGQRLGAVTDLLSAGGIPTTRVAANGQFVAVRFEHIWVEAHVPTDAYRGVAEDGANKQWLPLTPSIKGQRFTEPAIDGFDTLLDAPARDHTGRLIEGAVPADDGSGILLASPTSGDASVEALVADADEIATTYLANEDIDVSALFGGAEGRTERASYLPASLPFRTRVVTAEWRQIPSHLTTRVTVDVEGADPFSMPVDPGEPGTGLNFDASFSEFVSNRVTLSYAPATPEDAEIVDAYHGMLNAPSYAAALIPVLRVDGRVVARGSQAVSPGYSQELKLTVRTPGFAAQVVSNPVVVGSMTAVATSATRTAFRELQEGAEALDAARASTVTGNVLTDARTGALMSVLGNFYFARNDAYNDLLARVTQSSIVRSPSLGLVATSVNVAYLAGFPVATRLAGLNIDVDHDVHAVVAKTPNAERAEAGILRMSGIYASSSESEVFNAGFGDSVAVSTASVFQRANAQRIPFLSIDSSNVAQAASSLQLSPQVEQEIRDAVTERDATVLVPQRNVSLGRWTGAGYVIDEGTSLHYRITGGANGGDYAPLGPPPGVGSPNPGAIDFGEILVEILKGGGEVLGKAVVAIASVIAPIATDLLECAAALDDADLAAKLAFAVFTAYLSSQWALALEVPVTIAGKTMPPMHFATLVGVTALAVTLSIMSSLSCADLEMTDDW